MPGMRGRMVRCSGHAGEKCFRAAKLIRFPQDASWFCGESQPYVPRKGRAGQQKQAKR